MFSDHGCEVSGTRYISMNTIDAEKKRTYIMEEYANGCDKLKWWWGQSQAFEWLGEAMAKSVCPR